MMTAAAPSVANLETAIRHFIVHNGYRPAEVEVSPAYRDLLVRELERDVVYGPIGGALQIDGVTVVAMSTCRRGRIAFVGRR